MSWYVVVVCAEGWAVCRCRRGGFGYGGDAWLVNERRSTVDKAHRWVVVVVVPVLRRDQGSAFEGFAAQVLTEFRRTVKVSRADAERKKSSIRKLEAVGIRLRATG